MADRINIVGGYMQPLTRESSLRNHSDVALTRALTERAKAAGYHPETSRTMTGDGNPEPENYRFISRQLALNKK